MKTRKEKRPVEQYDLAGKFIAKYESSCEAARQTNGNRSAILRTCYGENKSSGGYYWIFSDLDNGVPIPRAFKQVSNYPEYHVSKQGRIFSTKSNRLLQPSVDAYGYEQVTIMTPTGKKKLKVHRLVAETFLLRANETLQVNHKDGVKTNNDIENLEWVTAKENINHAYAIGLMRRKAS